MFGVEGRACSVWSGACRGGRGRRVVDGGACTQRRDQSPPPSALSLTDRVSRRGERAATERLVKSVLGTDRSGTFCSPTGSQACGSSDSCAQPKLGLRRLSGGKPLAPSRDLWEDDKLQLPPARRHPEALSLLLAVSQTALSLSWPHWHLPIFTPLTLSKTHRVSPLLLL